MNKIYITDVIDNNVPRELLYLLNNAVGDIEMYINSPGGCAISGFAGHDLIKSYNKSGRGTITTIGYGLVASAASMLFLGSESRVLSRNCIVVIHNSAEEVMYSIDTAETAEERSIGLSFINNTMCNIYEKNLNIPLEEIKDIMNKDRLLTSEYCLEIGFCNKIEE